MVFRSDLPFGFYTDYWTPLCRAEKWRFDMQSMWTQKLIYLIKEKMKVKKEYKKFIKEWINYYEKELCIYDFNGDIFYVKDDENEEGRITNAKISVDHRYLTADYYIYPNLLKKFEKKDGKDEIKRILAHEVAHLATHKLHHMAISIYKDEGETIDAWENTTERVGRLLYKVGYLKSKKK